MSWILTAVIFLMFAALIGVFLWEAVSTYKRDSYRFWEAVWSILLFVQWAFIAYLVNKFIQYKVFHDFTNYENAETWPPSVVVTIVFLLVLRWAHKEYSYIRAAQKRNQERLLSDE